MRNYTLCIFILTFLMGSEVHLAAQENEFLRGKVLDRKTGEPVVFATVRIKGKAKGVITNMDGSFRLPLFFRGAGERIWISSMGYEKKDYALQELSPKDVNIIYLSPGVFSLEEAVVSAKRKRKPSAKGIVRRAIENIPNNYPTGNFNTKGYYRDYQLDSLEYVNLNEALLQVFDSGFDEIDSATTKTRIYDYAQNKNFRRDTLADDSYNYKDWRKIINNAYLKAYGGNEFAILRVHDAIRNYQINSFDFINDIKDGDILKNHSFKRLLDTYLDGERLYTIQLKKAHPDYTAKGTIYISQTDYAIHKLEYAVYDDRKRNHDDNLREQGIKGQLIFEVTSEYKRGQDSKMYLNYISFHNTFELAEPAKFVIDDFLVSASKGAFILTFNNKLASSINPESSDWYDFKYNDEKIKFESIKKVNDYTIPIDEHRVIG